jgi:hypothetical protein
LLAILSAIGLSPLQYLLKTFGPPQCWIASQAVKAGRAFELLATNPLGDTGMATPAISEGVLYFRTGKHLMAIGN